MTKYVYTAGGITGLSYDEAVSWRKMVQESLAPYGIETLSPMRGKEFLANDKEIAAFNNSRSVLTTDHGIVTRDRFDVRRADAILMNLLKAPKVSIGTMFEAAWAFDQRTPLVLVMENDNIHQHPFLREAAGYIVEDLESGITIIKHILSTGT